MYFKSLLLYCVTTLSLLSVVKQNENNCVYNMWVSKRLLFPMFLSVQKLGVVANTKMRTLQFKVHAAKQVL